MCAPIMEKVQLVLERSRTQCGLNLEQIDYVELVGGACRGPWLKAVIQKNFGHELSTTMNADESVARGCALQAAILSPLYKVREFKVEDRSAYGINICVASTDEIDG